MKKILFLLCFLFIGFISFSQNKKCYPVAFYNVENLFDTIPNVNKLDDDFTPNGKYNWTEDKYLKKVSNIAQVISKLGTDYNKSGITLIGLAEVENKEVIEDIMKQDILKSRKYRFVHRESPDLRGIDVALIYDYEHFKIKKISTYKFSLPGRKEIKTRDILVVSGLLAEEPFAVLINHWPSRREQNSSILRQRAATLCKQIADSIYNKDPATNIIIMGDLNDNPDDTSTRVILNAKRNKSQVQVGGFYNTMWNLYSEGKGSLKYGKEWCLFDQILISECLIRKNKDKLTFIKSEIYNRDYLSVKEGKEKGSPLRTFRNNRFIGGFSDHFPVLIYLAK